MNKPFKGFFLLLITILLNFQASGQKPSNGPYQIIRGTDIGILAGGGVMTIVGNVLQNNTHSLTESEVLMLTDENISLLDKSAITQFSPVAREWSNALMFAAVASPFCMLTKKPVRRDYAVILVMTAEVLLVNNGLTDLTKGVIRRNRPLVYNPDVSLDDKTKKGTRHSFFSGHTSNAASMSFLTAHIINQYSESKIVRTSAWAAAAGLSAAVGVFRYQAGKHFFTDIATGFVVGAATGYFIPQLHLSDKSTNNDLSILVNPGNVRLIYNF